MSIRIEIGDSPTTLENTIMAKLTEVQAALVKLKADFLAALATELGEVRTQIQKLKDQISTGSAATEADLDGVLASIADVGTSVTSGVDSISTNDGADATGTGTGTGTEQP